MPLLPGYPHIKGEDGRIYNIPLTTKGKVVEDCLARCYPACRKGHPLEDENSKRICAAVCHKRCG